MGHISENHEHVLYFEEAMVSGLLSAPLQVAASESFLLFALGKDLCASQKVEHGCKLVSNEGKQARNKNG